MARELVLVLIVSADILLISAAYRSSEIKIPITSAVVINLISSAVLGGTLLISRFAGHFIDPRICHMVGFIVLNSIGTVTVFKSMIRNLVRRLSSRGELSLRPGSSGIVIKLYLDDTAADLDKSKVLSVTEAAALALAASLDSAAMGLASGCNGVDPLISVMLSMVIGCIAIALGCVFGKKIASLNHDLSWLGGAALIVFAIAEGF